MHVLIATDGSIDVAQAVPFATALTGTEGKTTVATVVRVPRRLVQDLRSAYGDQPQVNVDSDAEYVGRPQSAAQMERSFPGDDALVDQYLGDKRIEICRPIAEAIREAGGDAESLAREGDEVEDIIMEIAGMIISAQAIAGAQMKSNR